MRKNEPPRAALLAVLIGLTSCGNAEHPIERRAAFTPSLSPSPIRRPIHFPPTVVGATNSGPGSDPSGRLAFREGEERVRREYEEQKQEELRKTIDESKKVIDDAVAMRELYARNPAEYWRVMEDRNERGCSKGDLGNCEYLAGLYTTQSRFGDARRVLLQERTLLEALSRNPEELNYGSSLPKAATIRILLSENAKQLDALSGK